jgi:hypothetical protein
MLGTVLSLVGFNLKRQVRQLALTAVFALLGAILLLLAFGFGIASLHEWLKFRYGTLPALGILGGTWAVLGIVLLCLAFLRPKGAKRAAAMPAATLQDPAAAIAQATEQAVHSATGLVREGSRKQVFGAIVIAALAGFLIGRRL